MLSSYPFKSCSHIQLFLQRRLKKVQRMALSCFEKDKKSTRQIQKQLLNSLERIFNIEFIYLSGCFLYSKRISVIFFAGKNSIWIYNGQEQLKFRKLPPLAGLQLPFARIKPWKFSKVSQNFKNTANLGRYGGIIFFFFYDINIPFLVSMRQT